MYGNYGSMSLRYSLVKNRIEGYNSFGFGAKIFVDVMLWVNKYLTNIVINRLAEYLKPIPMKLSVSIKAKHILVAFLCN